MPYRNLTELQTACRQKQKLKYLFFWGHTPVRAGEVDKAVLSQWYPAPFTLDGVRYATAEHYMMAQKAARFADRVAFATIIASDSPGKAKALGRAVANFEDATWQAARFDIVCAGNLGKFSQNPALQTFLLNTGDKILVEASPQDRIWGIGLAASDPRAADPLQWLGENLLGFALMQVRAQLRGNSSR